MQIQYQPGYAWAAAGVMLLVSWTQLSFLGLLYQFLFAIWSTIIISSIGRRMSLKGHLYIWICATCISCIVSIAVWALQIYQWVNPEFFNARKTLSKWLDYCGLIDHKNGWEIVKGQIIPMLAILVFGYQILLTKKLIKLSQLEPESNSRQKTLSREKITNKGIFLGLTLIVTTISWPAILSFPYAFVVVYALISWSQNRIWNIPAWQVWLLQAYGSLHLFLIYIVQIPFFSIFHLEVEVISVLGIFRLLGSAPKLTFWSQILMIVGLHCLHAALGMYTTIAEKLDEPIESIDEVEEPLLQDQVQTIPPDQFEDDSEIRLYNGSNQDSPNRYNNIQELGGSTSWDSGVSDVTRETLKTVVPYLVEQVYKMVEWLCSSPDLGAAWLCLFSLLEPSVLAGFGMLLGLWVLLTPKKYGSQVLQRISPTISEFAIVWFLVTYVVSCFARIVQEQAYINIFSFIGVFVYSEPYPSPCRTCGKSQPGKFPVFVPLVGMLFLVTVLCGVSRKYMQQQSQPTGGSSVQSMQTQLQEVQQFFKKVGTYIVRILWYLGFILVPFTWFLVGVTKVDVLHALYLVFLLVNFMRANYRFTPPIQTAVVGYPTHFYMRLYASIHIAIIYVSMIGYSELQWSTKNNAVLSYIGLLGVEVVSGILPVMLSFLVATFHSRAGRFLENDWNEYLAKKAPENNQVEDTRQRHCKFLKWSSEVIVAYGASLVVFVGYFMVIFGYQIGLLGLGYLLLLLILFMYPPVKTYYKEDTREMHSGEEGETQLPKLAKVQGSKFRWLPMILLSIFATLDLICQYPMLTIHGLLDLKTSSQIYILLHDIIGLAMKTDGVQATTGMLVSVLIRPALFLSVISLYRFLFAIDMDENNRKKDQETDEQKTRRRLKNQQGYLAFFKRTVILHVGKLIVMFAFAAIMQSPGIIGIVLLWGIVVIIPSLTGPRFNHRQWLYITSLVMLDLAVGLWMLAEYAFQIQWVRYQIFNGWDSPASHKMEWIGLSRDSASRMNLECALRYKFLTTIAIGLKFLSIRWLNSIPTQIRVHAQIGQVCPLFWPPPGYALVQQTSETQEDQNQLPTFLRPFATALQKLSKKFRSFVKREKEAVAQQELKRKQLLRGFSGMSRRWRNALMVVDLINSQEEQGPKWRRQLRLLVEAIRELVQQFWSTWGLEVCLLSLIITAFMLLNALSLILMFLVVLGMCLPVKKRIQIFRWLILPTLGILIMYQYIALFGRCLHNCNFHHQIPQIVTKNTTTAVNTEFVVANFNRSENFVSNSQDFRQYDLHSMYQNNTLFQGSDVEQQVSWNQNLKQDVDSELLSHMTEISQPTIFKEKIQNNNNSDALDSSNATQQSSNETLNLDVQTTYWLGYYVSDWLASALWGLMLSFLFCTIQVSFEKWIQDPQKQQKLSASLTFERRSSSEKQKNQETQRKKWTKVTKHVTSIRPIERQQADLKFAQIWSPIKFSNRASWTALDWLRFVLYRNSVDIVLVAVAALCFVVQNFVHLLYLGLALYYFRRRTKLREYGNKEFRYLPILNLIVMVFYLVYQAPLGIWFDQSWIGNNQHDQTCAIHYVIGIRRFFFEFVSKQHSFETDNSAFQLSVTGASIDIILWIVLRIQTRMFASGVYQSVKDCVKEEQKEEKSILEEKKQLFLQQQGEVALNMGHLREERGKRIKSLKEGLFREGGINMDLIDKKDKEEEQNFLNDSPGQSQVFDFLNEEEKNLRLSIRHDIPSLSGALSWEAVEKSGDLENQKDFQVNRQLSHYYSINDANAMTMQEIAQNTDNNQNFQGQSTNSQNQVQKQDSVISIVIEPQNLDNLENVQQKDVQYPKKIKKRQSQDINGEYFASAENVPFDQPSQNSINEIKMQEQQDDIGHQNLGNNNSNSNLQQPHSSRKVNRQISFSIGGESEIEPERNEDEQVAEQPKESWYKKYKFLRVRNDKDSYSCYFLFFVLFVADMSIISVIFLVSMLMYALITQSVSRVYWKITLLISEICLILMYAYLILSTLNCFEFINWADRHGLQQIGFHSSAITCLPMFLVYLATLMHSQQLDRYYGETPSKAFNREWDKSRDDVVPVNWLFYLPVLIWRFLKWIASWIFLIFSSTSRLLYQISAQHERGPSWIKITLNHPECDVSSDLIKQQFQNVFQEMFNKLRLMDISKRKQRQRSFSRIFFSNSTSFVPIEVLQIPVLDDHRKLINLGSISPLKLTLQKIYNCPDNSDDVVLLFQVETVYSTQKDSPYKIRSWPARSIKPAEHAMQALQRLHDYYQMVRPSEAQYFEDNLIRSLEEESGTEMMLNSSEIPVEYPPPNLMSQSRKHFSTSLSMSKRTSQQDFNKDDGSTSVVTNVVMSPASSKRFLVDLNDGQRKELDKFLFSKYPGSSIRMKNLEHFSRTPVDSYAVVLFFDFLVFILVSFAYQFIISSPTSSLSDITGEQVLPIRFLFTLMILFALMVIDRVVYSLGSHFGKVVLFVFQIVLFCYYCMHFFWLDATGLKGKWVLRGIMILKSFSLYWQAVQIKYGYPPRTSLVPGRGRAAFYLYRHPDILHFCLYNVFQMIPFMFELRILLDWACSPTTMCLMDWYMLEDIRRSLYEREADLKMRHMRNLGDKQMLYIKLLMGGVLFFIILLFLWMPLLLFSNFNPSNEVPSLVGVDVTVSLQSHGKITRNSDKHVIQNYELFQTGSYFSVQPWFEPDYNAMPASWDFYQPDQFQLVCQTQDSARAWEITPPIQKVLLNSLNSSEVNMKLIMDWKLTRSAPPSSPPRGPVCSTVLSIPLANATKQQLHKVLNNELPAGTTIPILKANSTYPNGTHELFGMFWRLHGDACGIQMEDTVVWVSAQQPRESLNCSLTFFNQSRSSWWQLSCDQMHQNSTNFNVRTCDSESEQGPMIIALLEMVTGSGLIGQTLTKFGITGLYFGIVLTIGRLFRSFVVDLRLRVPFYDFPAVERLVMICQDIYIARDTGELMLEEELFYSLINIYRKPDVLYELTKKKRS